jgi:hypothetical protein
VKSEEEESEEIRVKSEEWTMIGLRNEEGE